MTAVGALAADELRALSGLAGWPLPPMLQEAAGDDDAATPNVVAVRCMLAHGVLRLAESGTGEPRIEPAPGVRQALAALAAADLLAEVETEVGGDLVRHVLAQGGGATVRLSEREPDIWSINSEASPLRTAVAAIVAAHTAACAPPAGIELTISVADHLRVDALVVEGFADEVEPALLDAGVAAGPARSWAAALTGRRGAGAVRVARRAADGSQAGGDVRWVAAGPRGLWLLEELPGEAPDPAAAATRISDVTPAAVTRAVAGLLGGPAEGTHEGEEEAG
jgi:hypothetical protein